MVHCARADGASAAESRRGHAGSLARRAGPPAGPGAPAPRSGPRSPQERDALRRSRANGGVAVPSRRATYLRTSTMAESFYDVLGVPKTADADAIKKAYRKLAKDLHPGQKPRQQEGGRALQVGEPRVRRARRPEEARALRRVRRGGAPRRVRRGEGARLQAVVVAAGGARAGGRRWRRSVRAGRAHRGSLRRRGAAGRAARGTCSATSSVARRAVAGRRRGPTSRARSRSTSPAPSAARWSSSARAAAKGRR